MTAWFAFFLQSSRIKSTLNQLFITKAKEFSNFNKNICTKLSMQHFLIIA